VDLPLPLGPIMPTTCPACTFNETPDSKGTPVSENLSKFTTLTLAPDRRCSDLLKYTSTGIESRCSLTSPSSPDPFPTNRIKSHLFRSQFLRGEKKSNKSSCVVNTSAQAGSKKRTPKTADLHHSTEQYISSRPFPKGTQRTETQTSFKRSKPEWKKK